MPSPTRFLLSFLAALLLSLDGPAASAQPRGAVGESVDVRRAEIQVRVQNRAGDPVRGLSRDRFRIRLGRQKLQPLAVEEVLDGSDELLLVVLVDNRSLRASSRDRALEQLQRELGPLLESTGLRVAVASMDDSLEVVQAPTSDPTAVRLALQSLQGAEQQTDGEGLRAVEHNARTTLEEVLRQLRGNDSDRIMAMASIDTFIGEFGGYARALNSETESVLGGLRRFVGGLATEPGHKAVLLLSDGFPVRPLGSLLKTLQRALSGSAVGVADGAESRTGQAGQTTSGSTIGATMGGGAAVQRDVSHELLRIQEAVDPFNSVDLLESLIAEANGNGVTFYTAMAPPGDALAAGARRDAGRGAELEVSDDEAALASLADGTGGFSQLSGDDLSGLLRRISLDYDHYYSVTIRPPESAEGLLSDLEVRVRGRGFVVRAPSSLVLARRVDDRRENRAILELAALQPLDRHALELTQVGAEPGPPGLFRVTLELVLPIARLGLRAEEGVNRADARIVVVVRDQAARPLETKELLVPLVIPDADLDVARAQFYRALIQLDLPAGEHELELGLWDEVRGVTSFLRQPVTVAR